MSSFGDASKQWRERLMSEVKCPILAQSFDLKKYYEFARKVLEMAQAADAVRVKRTLRILFIHSHAFYVPLMKPSQRRVGFITRLSCTLVTTFPGGPVLDRLHKVQAIP
jgi:hypothetical protein